MDEKMFDLQSARNLFSKAQKISFGFLNKLEMKTPFVALHFKPIENKQADLVFQQLWGVLKEEKFKLSINENGGEFLSVSFLWESRSIIFSSSPDRYNKRECREFRRNVFYGDIVKLFFYIDMEEKEFLLKNSGETKDLDSIYYEYLP